MEMEVEKAGRNSQIEGFQILAVKRICLVGFERTCEFENLPARPWFFLALCVFRFILFSIFSKSRITNCMVLFLVRGISMRLIWFYYLELNKS